MKDLSSRSTSAKSLLDGQLSTGRAPTPTPNPTPTSLGRRKGGGDGSLRAGCGRGSGTARTGGGRQGAAGAGPSREWGEGVRGRRAVGVHRGAGPSGTRGREKAKGESRHPKVVDRPPGPSSCTEKSFGARGPPLRPARSHTDRRSGEAGIIRPRLRRSAGAPRPGPQRRRGGRASALDFTLRDRAGSGSPKFIVDAALTPGSQTHGTRPPVCQQVCSRFGPEDQSKVNRRFS